METASSSPPDTSILTPLDADALVVLGDRAQFPADAMEMDDYASDGESNVAPAVKRKDKGKGKALLLVDLPEPVWTRIFEHYYDDVCEEWNVDNQYHDALTPLLLSKDLLAMSMPVFYRHPHVNYRSLTSFARCIKLPLWYSHGDKLSLVRHLTIRPSHTPISQTTKSPAQTPYSLRANPVPVYRYTVHPSLHTVCQLFTELTSFTLKDTLVRHWSDAKLLFGSLKHLRPRKARLEIRMWDLGESPLGRDLVAASSPNVHAEFSMDGAQVFRLRTPQWTVAGIPWDDQAREGRQGESDRTQMMQRWRDALMDGGELHFPAWWIEPPPPNPNFAAAAAAANQQVLLGPGMINNHNATTNNVNGHIGHDGTIHASNNSFRVRPRHHVPDLSPLNNFFHFNSASFSEHADTVHDNATASSTFPHPAEVLQDQSHSTHGLSANGIPGDYLRQAQAPVQQSSFLGPLWAAEFTGPIPADGSSSIRDRVRITDVLDDEDDVFEREMWENMERQAAAAAVTVRPPADHLLPATSVAHPSGFGGTSRSSSSQAVPLDEPWIRGLNSTQNASRLPRGGVLLAAGSLGRQRPTTATNNVTGPTSSSIAGGSSSMPRQRTQTADALERLRHLRMSQNAESVGQPDTSSSAICRPGEHLERSLLGLGHGSIDLEQYPTVPFVHPVISPSNQYHLPASASAPARDGHAAQDHPVASLTPNTTEPAGPSNAGSHTTPPSPPSTSAASGAHNTPSGYVADSVRSMRMDHLLPTQEELQQYGNEWYLHHQEPIPWTFSPTLRIDPSPASVPGPRAADTARRSMTDDADDDPALAVTYLGVTGHALAHEMRGMLLDLLDHFWAPTLQAFAFQALDPLATLIVRDPRLMFWIKLGIPHIRVHLPRSINSLAVFKDAKTCQRDRQRAARRAEQAAAAAPAAAPMGGAEDAASAPLAPMTAQAAGPAAVPTALLVGGAAGIGNGTTGTNHALATLVEDEEDDRVVGGDERGGDLVHDGTRLFEIEVNTLQEMANDEQWHRAGRQLPPQVCRVLAGDRAHDWRDVRVGPRGFSPNYVSGGGTPISLSSSQFLSPTFSFVDMESEGGAQSERSEESPGIEGGTGGQFHRDDGTGERGGVGAQGDDVEFSGGERRRDSAGESYDAEAARAQKKEVKERKHQMGE